MSAQGLPAATAFGVEVIDHLGEQISSGRRLLGSILAQGKAIREQDVEGVVSRLGDIKTEMDLRGRLEGTRSELLTRAGQQLGIPPAAVTLEALTTLMAPLEAAAARERSAELRGLLAEVGRQHQANRILMRQELAFLEHLTRLLGGEEHGGYAPPGAGAPVHPAAMNPHRVLDMKA